MKLFRTNKIKRSLLISYIVISFIASAATLYTYSGSKNILKEEMHKSDEAAVKSSLNAIDTTIGSMTPLVHSIGTSGPFKVLSEAALKDDLATQQAHNLSQILSDYIALNNFDMICIYFPALDTCVSDSFIGSFKGFYDNFYTGSSLSVGEYKSRLSASNQANYLLHSNKSVDFIFNLRTSSLQNTNAICVINMSHKNFENIIKKFIPTSEKNIYIIDENNSVIFSSIDGPKSTVSKYSEYASGKPASQKGIITSASMSDINKWFLISQTPNRAISGSIKSSYINILLFWILSVCLTAYFIFFFIRKNYKPIASLTGIVSRSQNITDADDANDEYDLIRRTLLNYTKDSQTLNNIQSRTKKIDKNILLSKLMRDSLEDAESITSKLKELDITFTSNQFAVCVFNVVNVDALFSVNFDLVDLSSPNIQSAEADWENEKKADYINIIITNVFEELISKTHKGYVFEYNGLNVAIISINPAQQINWREDLTNANKELCTFIEDNFNFSISTYSSGLYSGISNLHTAYSEAIKALRHGMYNEGSKIAFYSSTASGLNEDKTIFSKTASIKLTDMIKSAEVESAANYANSLAQSILQSGNHIALELFFFKLCNTVLEAVLSFGIDIDSPKLRGLLLAIEQINNLSATTRYSDSIYNLIYLACDIIEKSNKPSYGFSNDNSASTGSEPLICDIKQYLKENYTDNEMNVYHVGLHFNISPYYISSLFKKSEKVDMISYISTLRIEAAKNILSTTSETLANIASQVGFSNSRSFIRVFKKLEGVTPSEYRKTSKTKA